MIEQLFHYLNLNNKEIVNQNEIIKIMEISIKRFQDNHKLKTKLNNERR